MSTRCKACGYDTPVHGRAYAESKPAPAQLEYSEDDELCGAEGCGHTFAEHDTFGGDTFGGGTFACGVCGHPGFVKTDRSADDEDECCRLQGCDGGINDGEGYDGYCGAHADQRFERDQEVGDTLSWRSAEAVNDAQIRETRRGAQ